MPCFVQQVPGGIGAGVPVQVIGGEEPKYWDPFFQKTDLAGSEYCASDPFEGWMRQWRSAFGVP